MEISIPVLILLLVLAALGGIAIFSLFIFFNSLAKRVGVLTDKVSYIEEYIANTPVPEVRISSGTDLSVVETESE